MQGETKRYVIDDTRGSVVTVFCNQVCTGRKVIVSCRVAEFKSIFIIFFLSYSFSIKYSIDDQPPRIGGVHGKNNNNDRGYKLKFRRYLPSNVMKTIRKIIIVIVIIFLRSK